MPRVMVSPAAADSLARLIVTHSLPPDTRERFRRSIAALGDFPLVGRRLEGPYADLWFVLGPWRWMVVVYEHDSVGDVVNVLAVEDARSSRAVTNYRF